MAPMNEIMKIAEANNLLVLEDAAQAHGAEIEGSSAGNWGDAAAFASIQERISELSEMGAL